MESECLKYIFCTFCLSLLLSCSTQTKSVNESNIDFVMRICENNIGDQESYNKCLKSAVQSLLNQPDNIPKKEVHFLLALVNDVVNHPKN